MAKWKQNKNRKSNKRFSVHNLYNEVLHNITSHDQIIMPDVWLNLSPAKTELFLLFALLNKLPTKDHLFFIGLCSLAMNKCVFCGQFGETANHLLFLCNKSWQLWSFFYNWLGVEVATPSSLLLWFQQWKALVQGHRQCQFWLYLFYAISWTLWFHRNEIIFESVPFSSYWLQKLVFFWVASWYNALSPSGSVSASDLL